ncbi:Gfo/Idh/MocA family oxidoreductase [Rossellomorea sp. SC111]|uniref:Gfo/Idh/MocA family protein n=1 Tax=Rossellomorea sp. SC111 TaxID=2968985 RepID=UPI00215B5018|nr:Gfo/Idh/MocA family oxidoreductase [Rossellomorea sp. SC111]MCR8850563.1 Gfo/Idh/MocA family oxidoreductase [Rossellomorea sp. SC111]
MIGFAIVGIGHISKKHIDAIHHSSDAKLVAICDNNSARLEEFKDKYNCYTDLEEMLEKQKDLDVVNICVPSGLHSTMTKLCAKHGKHVIVEKPMALKEEDAQEMMRTSEEYGIKLSVVHPNRFRPAFIELKKHMEKGDFGKLSHANATVRWNRNQEYYDQAPWRGTKEFDGGVLMNQAIHDIDLMLWLMGPVKSVQSMVTTRLRDIESEDVAMAVVEFESGALGMIEAATTIYPTNLEESLSIFGEKASVKISGKTANYIETWNMEGLSDDETLSIKEKINNDPIGKPGHQWIIEDMVKAIKEDTTPIVSGLDGYTPVKLISAIIESSESGSKVYL